MINEKDIKKKILVFSNRLSDLIDDTIKIKKKTREAQAAEMGITKGNLSKYCASNNLDKNIPKPRADTLMQMADYYGVSIDYLLARTDRSTLPEEDKNLIRDIRDYIGLNETAIGNLQKAKKHYFKRLIINEILSNEDLIEALTIYYASSFVDLYKKSDYFNLPQNDYKFNDILGSNLLRAKQASLLSLEDCLSNSRDDFFEKHSLEIETKNRKSETLRGIARIFVDLLTAEIETKEFKVSPYVEASYGIMLQKITSKEDIIKHHKELLEELKDIK